MLGFFVKHRKKAMTFFSRHVEYNALVHVLGGIGLGILIAVPFAYPHPVKWALILLAISLSGHLYAFFAKK